MADRPDWPEPGAHSGAMTPPVPGWGDRARRDGLSEGAPAPMSSPGEPARHQRDPAGPEPDRSVPTGEVGPPPSAPAGPGDPAALQQGCRCPTLANRPEAGDALNALVAPDCPMHHPAPPGETPHHSALEGPPEALGHLPPPTARADGVGPG